MKVEAIVLAGGKGSRLSSDTKKQYIKILDKEILFRTLEKFEKIEVINNVTIVCENEEVDHIKSYGFNKVVKFAEAGTERMNSVYNAIKLLDSDTDFVIVHDGVRPFFDEEKVSELIEKTSEIGGAIYAVKSTDTIKKVIDGRVVETVNRENLYNVQTPQCFKKDLLIKAYDFAIEQKIFCTDDSMIIEKANLGYDVAVVESDYNNIKITTKIDLEIGKSIIRGEI